MEHNEDYPNRQVEPDGEDDGINIYRDRKSIADELSGEILESRNGKEWYPARPIGYFYGVLARSKLAYQVFKGKWDLIGKEWKMK